MKKPIFITGNKNKSEALGRYLGLEISTKKLDIKEIQSLDLTEIAEHKARVAYEIIGKPVLVEDAALYYSAFKKLSGTLIHWFYQELGNAGLCRIVNHYKKDRSATAEVCFGYFDGKKFRSFSAKIDGKIAPYPRGKNGFGWDPVFIPDGYNQTFGEMTLEQKDKISMRHVAAGKLAKFLKQGD